ncbi:MAG: glycosyltransferase family 2 protein [Thermoguttaceae bacterium]|jgi:hypothetical protein
MIERVLTALPVYNEVAHVSAVLDGALSYCPYVLAVDDGSDDGTAAVLAGRRDVEVLAHPRNLGYGAALRSAFDFAVARGYEVLVTIDCDGQHQPQLIPRFVEQIAGADIVSGSRYLRKFPGDSDPPAQRREINQLITTEVNRRLGLGLTDAFCGFKAYRVSILPKFRLRETGYAMPLELWVQAARLGLRIVEVAVPLIYLDERRSFGGALDHAATRMEVYRRVLDRAAAQARGLSQFSSPCPPGQAENGTVPFRSAARRLAAPRENRALLVEPPLEDIAGLVAENVRQRDRHDYDFGGRSLADLRLQARAELLAEARRWTAAYRPPAYRPLAAEEHDPRGPIFLAGHQPELFHPGVWLKNFALGAIARRHGAAAVNLVIDSDVLKGTSLAVPGGSVADARLESLALDQPGSRIPYEERPILDRGLFADFGRRVAERLAPLVPDPLIRQYWPLVVGRSQAGDRLGYCLARGRHELEGRWGLETIEVPQSAVCECESFRWFAVHLLAQLPRFHRIYNEVVGEYRRVHGIRNAAQPVPDLAADGPWLEAPLWIWTAQRPERRRLFASVSGGQTIVSDREGLEFRLSPGPHGDAAAAVEQLAQAGRQGLKLRSRALVTTLWARLALGDLFIHGIGGAKYDQLTDRLIERFFALPPPGILVLSATLHLPIPRRAATPDEARRIRRELRDLTFQPERFLTRPSGRPAGDAPTPAAPADELMAAKRRWIGTPQTAENAYQRWSSLRQINAELQPWVAPRRRELLELQSQTARALRAEQVLGRRDYAFCLYPEKELREFIQTLLHKIDSAR